MARVKTATYLNDLEATVIAHITRPCPPRPCMDPDHPSYSDPGDPGECSVEAVFLTNRATGAKVDITECLTEEELAAITEDIFQQEVPDAS